MFFNTHSWLVFLFPLSIGEPEVFNFNVFQWKLFSICGKFPFFFFYFFFPFVVSFQFRETLHTLKSPRNNFMFFSIDFFKYYIFKVRCKICLE